MVQWYHVRFAFERPRVRSPIYPFFFFEFKNNYIFIFKNKILYIISIKFVLLKGEFKPYIKEYYILGFLSPLTYNKIECSFTFGLFILKIKKTE